MLEQPQTLHPINLVVWAGVEELLKDSQLAGLIALGRAIANALPGETLDEKLDQFEGGRQNRERVEHERAKGSLIRLRRDLFSSDCCGLPWSRRTVSLLDRYNNEVHRGGAAMHPLHIVLHEVHRGLGYIVDVATRDPISGQVSFSHYGLQHSGLTEEEALDALGDAAILYCICNAG